MPHSVQDAWRLIEQHVAPAAPVRTRLAEADGLVTAEPIQATGDSPPFDKALMDGYAIRSEDFAAGRREFRVIADVTAGKTTDKTVESGTAIRIMTGAPIPNGADCVIPVELARSSASEVTF